jgi:glycosidase
LQDYPEPATAVMLNLLGSHDTARPMTVVHRRDGGSHALESLKLMAAMQFTCMGAPCIYYGDEIGMEGDKDPDCRRCYPWDWEQRVEESGQRAELLAYYKKLITVRKDNPALRHGVFHTLEADPHYQFYAFERHSPDSRCIVALNRSDHDRALPLSSNLLATELLSNHPIRNGQVTVPARQAIIVNLAAFDAKALARRLYWGGFNQTATARKLNEQGMTHPAGRKWRQKDVAALV